MLNGSARKSPSANTLVSVTAILVFVGLSALFVIVGMTTWLGVRSEDYFTEIIKVRDFRSAVVELRSALQAAETSQRGYLLTGNEIYLGPFGLEKGVADRNISALSEALSNNSGQAASFDQLKSVIDQKFAEMDETISLKRAGRDGEVAAILRTNKGKRLTDVANVYFSGLVNYADQRLDAASAEQNRNFTLLQIASLIGGVVIVMVAGAAAVLVLRYTRALANSRDELNALNADLERRVKERTAHLAQLNEEVRRFAYIVTHDLRAPLVNIMGFTREIEESVSTAAPIVEAAAGTDVRGIARPEAQNALVAIRSDIPEAISFVKSSTQKMDALINAILKLSREGQRKLRLEKLDLKEMIDASIAAMRHNLSASGGRVDLQLAVPHIVSDRPSIEQIFGNILENAIKYRSKDRALQIAVTSRMISGRRVVIGISDNGRGIAEDDRERVFELFRRSGAQDQPGEGIGLAHVRTLVRNLGGDITLESRLGQGTTFSIELPVADAEEEPGRE